ncbi:MAG: P1 family peptidase [Gemmatimonadetes bacterium]|nr:P1 family peptidase [Gemmatimonadota bacterium]
MRSLVPITLLAVAALAAAPSSAIAQSRARARDLGVPLDGTPRGPVRTGVTAILPRGRATLEPVFAAYYAGNGNGDMTGTHWIEETGVLETPIMITNTLSVGIVRDAVVDWMVKRNAPGPFWYPVVAETSDGGLNDMKGLHVKAEHAFQALDAARPGAVAEGNVGGGTGMNCNGFKGGTGTSSRVLSPMEGGFTVGVLVQCNYGTRSQLRIAGIPVGREVTGLEPCVAQRLDPPLAAFDGRPLPVCGAGPGAAMRRRKIPSRDRSSLWWQPMPRCRPISSSAWCAAWR